MKVRNISKPERWVKKAFNYIKSLFFKNKRGYPISPTLSNQRSHTFSIAAENRDYNLISSGVINSPSSSDYLYAYPSGHSPKISYSDDCVSPTLTLCECVRCKK